jgi:hypothetical protein
MRARHRPSGRKSPHADAEPSPADARAVLEFPGEGLGAISKSAPNRAREPPSGGTLWASTACAPDRRATLIRVDSDVRRPSPA